MVDGSRQSRDSALPRSARSPDSALRARVRAAGAEVRVGRMEVGRGVILLVRFTCRVSLSVPQNSKLKSSCESETECTEISLWTLQTADPQTITHVPACKKRYGYMRYPRNAHHSSGARHTHSSGLDCIRVMAQKLNGPRSWGGSRKPHAPKRATCEG